MTLVVIMTCHNRKENTLACLKSLVSAFLPVGMHLHVVLLDDGSHDGTSKSVAEHFPDVEILFGDGNLYWAGGMRKLMSHIKHTPFDYCLWLNDDTYLFQDSLTQLFDEIALLPPQSILIGSTKDPDTLKLTYGGFKKISFLSPLHLRQIKPDPDSNIEVDTLNGNCVLIPRTVFEKIGPLDSHFTHGLADLDYGFSARRKGVQLFIARHFVGYCKRNITRPGTSIGQRLKRKKDLKNLPVQEWKYYVKKNGGILWPYYFIAPYLKAALSGS